MVLRAQMINFFTINLEDFSQLGFSMTGTPRQKTKWRTKTDFSPISCKNHLENIDKSTENKSNILL